MKKALIPIAMVLLAVSAVAQITTTQVQPQQRTHQQGYQTILFDSAAVRMTSDNLLNSAWQILYLPALSGNESIMPLNLKPSSSREERAKYYGYSSKYQAHSINNQVEGKYYVVTNVKVQRMKGDGDYVVLDLSEKDNPANQWKYATKALTGQFPFIVLSHYNYLKSVYLGNERLFRMPYLEQCRDIEGKPIASSPDTITLWRCSEISVAQLSNGEDGTVSNRIIIIYTNGRQSFYVEEEDCPTAGIDRVLWEDITSRYPIEYCQLVLQQKVRIGMPLELLELSLGKPKKINERAYNDIQYIYDNAYVSIRDGIVTSWMVY